MLEQLGGFDALAAVVGGDNIFTVYEGTNGRSLCLWLSAKVSGANQSYSTQDPVCSG